MLTRIEHPDHGAIVCGYKRSRNADSVPRFSAATAPTVFKDVNSIRAAAKTGQHIYAVVENMLLNNQIGDCAIAAALKCQAIQDCLAGRPMRIPSITDALWLYSQCSGPPAFNPATRANDTGCELETVLAHWQSRGLYQDGYGKIKSFAAVDARNPDEVKAALTQNGVLYAGCLLPKKWEAIRGTGFTWPMSGDPDPDAGHCFTAETKVPLLDGRELTMEELSLGAAGNEFWVYSCDDAGNIVPGLARLPRKTRNDVEIIEVVLDNGETIRCTPDHRFMLRNGEYAEASSLAGGASLMPLYRKLTPSGYEAFYNPRTKGWRSTYREVAKYINDSDLEGLVVHHCDYNKNNNDPDNLMPMLPEEHTRLHLEASNGVVGYAKSDVGRARSRELMNALWADPIWAAKMRASLATRAFKAGERAPGGFDKMDPERLRKMGSENGKRNIVAMAINYAAHAKISATKREKFAANPELRARQTELARAASLVAASKPRTAAQIEAGRRNIVIARAARANNHKVVSTRSAGRADVYDLTVDKHHNFALSAGVFVHNCTFMYGCNETGVFDGTWGLEGTIPWDALAYYFSGENGELYTVAAA